jgi:hypothetical protein
MLSSRATYEDKSSAQDASRRYTHSCLDMGKQHADACSALDTSRRMQEHAKVEIRAYTCRPSIRACTCMVLMHADAYSHTLWTNAE